MCVSGPASLPLTASHSRWLRLCLLEPEQAPAADRALSLRPRVIAPPGRWQHVPPAPLSTAADLLLLLPATLSLRSSEQRRGKALPAEF